MISKLIFAPIPLLLGGWMFTSSFSSSTIQQSVTPYSTQQQTVEVEMPEPAKSFLRLGGGAIPSVSFANAIFGTSSLVFWELASKKRLHARPQLLLSAGQNFVPDGHPIQNNFQPMDELNNREHVAQSVPHNQEQFVRSQFSGGAKQPNNPEALKQIPHFYQTDGLPSSLSNEKVDSVRQFDPQSKSEDKYASVRSRSDSEGVSLVYENTVGIVGKEKGSGKTSKLGYLIAEHIKLGHLVWMVNPFAKGQHSKGIKVFGRGYNFLEATNAIREFTRIAFWRIAEAGDETKEYEPFEDYHLNLALDEMSNYSSEIDAIDSTVMPKFWEAVVQFLRAREYVRILCQSW
jgi:hypothetical protein